MGMLVVRLIVQAANSETAKLPLLPGSKYTRGFRVHVENK